MAQRSRRPKLATVGIAIVEIAFIIFLFYTNLLMGEFTRSARPDPTLWSAIVNVVTMKTFGIALASASIGFIGFDYIRKRL